MTTTENAGLTITDVQSLTFRYRSRVGRDLEGPRTRRPSTTPSSA